MILKFILNAFDVTFNALFDEPAFRQIAPGFSQGGFQFIFPVLVVGVYIDDHILVFSSNRNNGFALVLHHIIQQRHPFFFQFICRHIHHGAPPRVAFRALSTVPLYILLQITSTNPSRFQNNKVRGPAKKRKGKEF